MAGWIKMPLGTDVGIGPGDIELDGESIPPKKGHSPQFLAHFSCGQTAGWVRIPLGTEVGLSPGDVMLDGDPAPPLKVTAPTFQPCLLCPNGWMNEDAT